MATRNRCLQLFDEISYAIAICHGHAGVCVRGAAKCRGLELLILRSLEPDLSASDYELVASNKLAGDLIHHRLNRFWIPDLIVVASEGWFIHHRVIYLDRKFRRGDYRAAIPIPESILQP